MNAHDVYGYVPSTAAAVIFIILFAGTTIYHSWQLIKARCWYFIPFVIGGLFQIVAYLCRALGHNNVSPIPLYALQTVMVLLAPPLYAASVYMVLGRTVCYLSAEHLSLIPVKWLTKIFVTGDVFSFLLQSAGGSLMAGSSSSSRTTGSNVVIGGMAVQLLFFGFFIIVAAIFHIRIEKAPTTKSQTERDLGRGQGWKQRNWVTILVALYVVSALILVRSIFRVIEYKYGFDGYIMTHEAFGYIFDTLLMFIAMVVMNVYHPAVILGDGKQARAQRYSEAVHLT